MEHPDWPAVVAAIVADPDDDTARLVAADFLEENGDPDRAAFIRIQVQLARLEADGQGKSLAVDELRKKERAFLGPMSMFRVWWAANDCPEIALLSFTAGRVQIVDDGAARVKWRRGFVDGVTCPAAKWEQHGEAVRRRNPVRAVTLTHCGSLTRDGCYRMLPALRGLRTLGLSGIDDSLAAWLGGRLPGVVVEVVPF